MKQLDRLIIKEIIGPWAFGVGMFTVLIVAASYLFKVTDFIVKGAPFWTVIEITFLLMPGVLVKTFAMAMLLAGLLGFGRLSGDSEIVALRAAGISVYRMVVPVACFAVVVAIVAFLVDETLVPWAAKRSLMLTAGVAKLLDPSALHIESVPIVDKGKNIGVVVAQNFDPLRSVLEGATVIAYNGKNGNRGYLWASEIAYDPANFKEGNGWRIQGGAEYLAADGSQLLHLNDGAWPPGIPSLSSTPKDIIAAQLNNPDVLSMSEIAAQIEATRKTPNFKRDQLANWQFWYWSKIALPLAAVIYGIMGAPLGIRNGRASAAAGFALAIAIIFGYITLSNLLNVYAMGGVLPAWVASFTPLVIGLIASIAIIRHRNG